GDHQFSDRDSLTLHYHEDQGTVSQFGTLNKLTSTRQAANNHIANIIETHIFSAAMTNELRLGFNRGPRNFYYSPFGVSGYPANLAAASISSPGISMGGSPNPNFSYYPTTAYQGVDNLNWTHGRNRLKFGTDVRRVGETFHTGASVSATYLNVTDFFANSPFSYSSVSENA